ncbi:bifunctional heptose 7-phosphate kinase/heptose 1-phosphate adenyltransferase [Streptomyces phage Blueeyedbeauty]|uniref:Nucleotidyltransferase n=1 Tax=Streptomyces phage Blueeyedbeauty TaxID=2250336 RepID=A0A345L1R9_9CAUD|nr:bifunctional heptose 7-phosphate kinase/heptose 1-phosphate adenyltransferase [Streptomyces phage Blueeyedbeauty]AXH49221.1 nucleotidyltransferase [Streptomyces phage Blueeyedbeauty]
MPNVYTGGTFDLFHEGHVELLRSCKRLAGDGKVVVALNSDEFIARFKNNPPVQTFRERKTVLESCRYVDLVIENIGEEDSKKTIFEACKIHMIEVIAIGSDWAGRDYYGQMGFTKEWLDRNDLILVYIDRRTGMSTTKIKDKLKNGS